MHGRCPQDQAAWRSLLDAASAPYRHAGRFAYHFARGKLGGDPFYRSCVEQGYWGRGSVDGLRVLDIGCGQALLASLATAATQLRKGGNWPTAWAAAPAWRQYTGLDLADREAQRARDALLAQPKALAAGSDDMAVHIDCVDVRQAAFPESDLVVIVDVLHYLAPAEQDAVLQRVRAALAPGGRLLLRVGDPTATGRFGLSTWVDRLVTLARRATAAPVHGRPVDAWRATLTALGFAVQALPMSQGTPFVNVLLVADVVQTAP